MISAVKRLLGLSVGRTQMPAIEIQVNIGFDEKAGVYFVSGSSLPGLVTEAESLDKLLEYVKELIPELVELNAHLIPELQQVNAFNHANQAPPRVKLELPSFAVA